MKLAQIIVSACALAAIVAARFMQVDLGELELMLAGIGGWLLKRPSEMLPAGNEG